MTNAVVRLLLIDDDETFLHHVARFLDREARVDVLASVSSAARGIEQAAALQPDVILLDLTMPDLDGFEALPLLASAAPSARVVAVTMHEADDYRELAFARGAHGFVPKSRLVDELVPEIARQHTLATGP